MRSAKRGAGNQQVREIRAMLTVTERMSRLYVKRMRSSKGGDGYV